MRSKEPGFRRFFIRRFFRIYPPYLLALLFFALIFPATRFNWSSLQEVANFTAHLVLFQNWDSNFIYAINGSFWSIAVEVQLYLLYPLLLWLTRFLGWRNCLILILGIELFSTNFSRLCAHIFPSALGFNALAKSPFTYWFSWGIGAKIADDWVAGRPIFLTRFPVWIWPLVFLAVSLLPIFAVVKRSEFTLAALATATTIAFLLCRPALADRVSRLRLMEHFRQIGLISYSAYLLHEPLLLVFPGLLGWAFPHFASPHSLTLLLCLLEWPFILLVSWGFYRWVELPAIAWGKSFQKRDRRP